MSSVKYTTGNSRSSLWPSSGSGNSGNSSVYSLSEEHEEDSLVYDSESQALTQSAAGRPPRCPPAQSADRADRTLSPSVCASTSSQASPSAPLKGILKTRSSQEKALSRSSSWNSMSGENSGSFSESGWSSDRERDREKEKESPRVVFADEVNSSEDEHRTIHSGNTASSHVILGAKPVGIASPEPFPIVDNDSVLSGSSSGVFYAHTHTHTAQGYVPQSAGALDVHTPPGSTYQSTNTPVYDAHPQTVPSMYPSVNRPPTALYGLPTHTQRTHTPPPPLTYRPPYAYTHTHTLTATQTHTPPHVLHRTNSNLSQSSVVSVSSQSHSHSAYSHASHTLAHTRPHITQHSPRHLLPSPHALTHPYYSQTVYSPSQDDTDNVSVSTLSPPPSLPPLTHTQLSQMRTLPHAQSFPLFLPAQPLAQSARSSHVFTQQPNTHSYAHPRTQAYTHPHTQAQRDVDIDELAFQIAMQQSLQEQQPQRTADQEHMALVVDEINRTSVEQAIALSQQESGSAKQRRVSANLRGLVEFYDKPLNHSSDGESVRRSHSSHNAHARLRAHQSSSEIDDRELTKSYTY